MIAPQYGDSVRVHALVGGIYVPQEGIWLKVPGDETEVVWSPFWQGELDLQRICLPVVVTEYALRALAEGDEEVEPQEVEQPEDQQSEVKPKKRKPAEAAMAEEPDEDAEE